MPKRLPQFDPARGRRILSDVVISPKRELNTRYLKDPEPKINPPIKRPGKSRKFSKLFLILILLLCGWLAYGFFTADMRIVLAPKTAIFALDRVVTLNSTADGENIKFSTVSVSLNKEGVFPGGEEATVERRARGTIVVYNKSSREPQTLIATTRFETLEGKVYRIPERIDVPGYTVESGSIIAGSLEVEVVADKPGESYNIGLADFTLPGFKNSPKFAEVYARSRTPMTGGFIGRERIVRKEDAEAAAKGLIESAEKEAEQLVKSNVLGGSFLLSPSINFNASDINISPEPGLAGEEFKVTITGEARGVFVDKRTLEELLTDKENIRTHFGGVSVEIANLSALDFEFLDFEYGMDSINMRVRGEMQVRTFIEPAVFKTAIIEKNLSRASDILAEFPGVIGAEVKFSPFWWKFVPGNPERIMLTI